MKLGKLAKKRERKVLKYLYENGPTAPGIMQADLYGKLYINVKQVLSDLRKTEFTRFANGLWYITEKGCEYIKNRKERKSK